METRGRGHRKIHRDKRGDRIGRYEVGSERWTEEGKEAKINERKED